MFDSSVAKFGDYSGPAFKAPNIARHVLQVERGMVMRNRMGVGS